MPTLSEITDTLIITNISDLGIIVIPVALHPAIYDLTDNLLSFACWKRRVRRFGGMVGIEAVIYEIYVSDQ